MREFWEEEEGGGGRGGVNDEGVVGGERGSLEMRKKR